MQNPLGKFEPGRPPLTNTQIREIQDAYAKGKLSQRQLARQYGVTQPTISRVVTGKRDAA